MLQQEAPYLMREAVGHLTLRDEAERSDRARHAA